MSGWDSHGWIADDPDPQYSQLDMWDGLPVSAQRTSTESVPVIIAPPRESLVSKAGILATLILFSATVAACSMLLVAAKIAGAL